MAWYEKFGYSNNPFETNLLRSDFEVIGLEDEKDEILYRVTSGSMVLIEGPEGSGKTALLKHIINNFKGKGKVIYVDGEKLNKSLDIESLLIKKNGLFKGKIMKKKPKGMILLLDNVSSISRKNCEKIKYYYDNDFLKSVVFTTKNHSSIDWDESITDRVDKRVIVLKSAQKDQLIELINGRIGDKNIFEGKKTIEIIAGLSQNPKDVLVNSENVAKFIAEKDNTNLDKEKIKKIIDEKKEEPIDESKITNCPKCGEKLSNINKYWRCENCDYFCSNCGALVEDEDKKCPECGKKFEE